MKKRTPLTDDEILAILTLELSNANITTSNPTELVQPLSYYLGRPNGTEVEGRSTLTSTDVADAIEWIMPQIMKSFTQNNEVVVFDPINEEDELQAQIESEYVYDVLMKQNNGFVIIHQFVKDALMQRNGILKVYYEDNTETKTYDYSGLTETELQVLASEKNVEIVRLSAENYLDQMGQEQQVFNTKLAVTNKVGNIRIDPVSPEEFRVNSQHNSIDLSEARFTCHIVTKTISDLREEGMSEEDIEDLAQADLIRSSYRFSLQNEPTIIPAQISMNDPNKLVEIGECYMKLDVNGDGITERYKITVGGVQPPVKILDKDTIDSNPWISTTCILMSHKFQGLSIYDRLKQIQDNKTAIIRNIMDNMYLQNNQRNVVVEGQVNIDDLLVSRPGGIIRAKRLDAITPLLTPQIGDSAFQMMNYLDQISAGRTGVSSDGTASPENIGDRVGSQGVERMMNAKEELVGLIIRVICETGIKPLCNKIRDLVTQHIDTIQDFKFQGQWIKVNPADWPQRTKTTVRVGTGTGDVRAKVAAIQAIQQIQGQIFAQPGQALVTPTKVYSTLDDFCKFSGLNGASKYFVDPTSPEGQQATIQAQQGIQQQTQQAQQAQIAQFQLESKLADSSVIAAKAQQANVALKGIIEQAKHQREMEKQSFEAKIATLTAELEQQKLIVNGHKELQELQFQYDQLTAQTAVALTKIDADAQADEAALYAKNEEMIDKDMNDE